MTALQDIYFITSCVGFLYVIVTAIAGSFHGKVGHHSSGGHSLLNGKTGGVPHGAQGAGTHGAPGGASARGFHGTGVQAHHNIGTHGQHGSGAHGQHGSSAHGQHGSSAQGQHGSSAQGQHGSSAQGQHGSSAHGQHGSSAHGQHGSSAQGQHGSSAQGQHGSSAQGTNDAGTGRGDASRVSAGKSSPMNSNNLGLPHSVQGQDNYSNSLTVSQNSQTQPSKPQVPTLYLAILDILSPLKLAFFAFLFGATGMLILKFIPGYLSAVPAAIISWILASAFFNLLGSMLLRMNSSTNFKKENLIGSVGELSLAIEAGTVGEIIVRTGSSRYNFPARAGNAEQTIKKLMQVIIVDIKDGIFVVEPFEENLVS